MGKYERKKKKRSCKWVWVLCLLILVSLLAVFVMPQVLYQLNGDAARDDIAEGADSRDQSEETAVTENGNTGYDPEKIVKFPALLDEGNIEIESLFPFSGVNPDAENQDATDVASIVLRNTSGQYLSEATVHAALDSGATLTFTVTELPAGTSAMAFSVDNDGLLSADICTDIAVEAVFGENPDDDYFDISVVGMTVTVTNTSPEDLNEIDVYYRDVFHDKYFGGMTYRYKIENLPAGESTAFTAEESLLGVIDVVRIAVNDKN